MRVNKKGQAQIITTVLIILLVLAAVVIVWQVIENFIGGKTEDISDAQECLDVNLNILSADAVTEQITIKREVGDGDLKAIAVVINGERKPDVTIDKTVLRELVEVPITISNFDPTDKIEIYAIVGNDYLCKGVEDTIVA